MTRKIQFSTGEYYHIYNRGTEKRLIFSDDKDYYRFLSLLDLCNRPEPIHFNNVLRRGRNRGSTSLEKETIVSIGAYCLMPNHFHILIREKQEKGISIFMQKLSTAYTMYFNTKKERSGALFQGRFKAEHVDSDKYLKYLFSYIHLNPVKLLDPLWKEKGIKDTKNTLDFLNSYKYSSYTDYAGHRTHSNIINPEDFPEYFQNKKDFNAHIFDWIE